MGTQRRNTSGHRGIATARARDTSRGGVGVENPADTQPTGAPTTSSGRGAVIFHHLPQLFHPRGDLFPGPGPSIPRLSPAYPPPPVENWGGTRNRQVRYKEALAGRREGGRDGGDEQRGA